MPAWNENRVERLDLFLNGHSTAVAQSLFSTEARVKSISLNYVFVFVLALGIGIVAGLRSLTSPAVVAWGADKLPMIPKRTAPAPLMARVVTGGLCGACLCAAVGKSLLAGTLLGGIGGIVGAFLGYGIRRRLDLHIKDLVVAACEDLVAVGLALFLVSR
jgi:uncharacterized membrane protein